MCLPSGFPSGMLYILPIQIVQNPKYIVIIPELQRAARIIPTTAVRTGKASSRRTTATRRKVGGRHAGHRTVNFKPWILDDYHYTDPTKSRWHTDALQDDGAPAAGRQQTPVPDHHRRSEDLQSPFSQDYELTLRPDWESSACSNTSARRTIAARR